MRIAKLGFAASILAGTAAHAVPVTSHSPIVEKQVATSCKTIDREELNKTGRTSVSEVLQNLPPANGSLDEHGCAPPQPTDPVNQEALAAQNAERASMGLPLFTYSPELAQRAQAWANVLPSIGRPDHSPREGRADIHENISQGLGDWSVGRLQYNWFKEKRYLKPGIFPDVSTTGNWEDVGHISQIDWRLTTQIGCGLSRGGGFSYLVCDYSPGGNKDGKPIGYDVAGSGAQAGGFRVVDDTNGPALPPVKGGNVDTNVAPPDFTGKGGAFDPRARDDRAITDQLKDEERNPAGVLRQRVADYDHEFWEEVSRFHVARDENDHPAIRASMDKLIAIEKKYFAAYWAAVDKGIDIHGARDPDDYGSDVSFLWRSVEQQLKGPSQGTAVEPPKLPTKEIYKTPESKPGEIDPM